MLTDTITASFDSLFKQVTQGIDVAVRSEETFGGFDTGEVRDPMPAALLERIQAVDGVRVAEGNVTGYAQLVGKDGKAVTTSGAPSLGVSFNQDPQFSAGSTVRSGRLPSGPDELAIDAKTAEDTGYKVGDRVKVLFQGPAREFTVSGVIGFGEADNLGGARLVGFDLPTAQEVMNREGRFDEIDAAAEAGVTPSSCATGSGPPSTTRSSRCSPARSWPRTRPPRSTTPSGGSWARPCSPSPSSPCWWARS